MGESFEGAIYRFHCNGMADKRNKGLFEYRTIKKYNEIKHLMIKGRFLLKYEAAGFTHTHIDFATAPRTIHFPRNQ